MDWLTEKPIAHRGLHVGRKIPENSMLSFKEAIKMGLPIELDVHLLKDGEVVVFHDEKLKRLTSLEGEIFNLSAKEVSSICLFETKETIPLLKGVLALVLGKVPLVIEIKTSNFNGELETAVAELLSNYQGSFSIQSFNPHSLIWFKENKPTFIRGLLSYDYEDAQLSFLEKFSLRNLLYIFKSAPHYLGIDINYLSSFPVRFARNILQIPTLTWTVKTKIEYEAIKGLCDNIIFEDIKLISES